MYIQVIGLQGFIQIESSSRHEGKSVVNIGIIVGPNIRGWLFHMCAQFEEDSAINSFDVSRERSGHLRGHFQNVIK